MNQQLFKMSFAAVLTLSPIGVVHASENPFTLAHHQNDSLQLAETTTAANQPNARKGIRSQLKSGGVSVLEGKCGSGKCGSQQVRQMMDGDGNGVISRREYNQWINHAPGSQFDRIDVNEDGIISESEMIYFETTQ